MIVSDLWVVLAIMMTGYLEKSDRDKDVNLNVVYNKLEELSVLGNTPKNQKFKGAFNIFESIAESNPHAQGEF